MQGCGGMSCPPARGHIQWQDCVADHDVLTPHTRYFSTGDLETFYWDLTLLIPPQQSSQER